MFTIAEIEDDAGPWEILRRILAYPEMVELKELLDSDVTLAILIRTGEWNEGGRGILGTCSIPTVSGKLRPLFEHMLEDWIGYFPDFLITLNADFWEEANPITREALLFHEAKHAGHAKDQFGSPRFHRETGRPITCIVPHDLEEFNAVVSRYGAWKGDVQSFLDAVNPSQKPHSALLEGHGENFPHIEARTRERAPAPTGEPYGEETFQRRSNHPYQE
ncbi:putative metallopeptidase [Parvibaculum sp.]|uniref:putative metallopeptidase n=1 Tax=Parvibaculum sp. TaxID=2024848 RepID=UPI0027354483|nr:putative metallopeptidase [Parvibaculum sp.]MDP3328738.1 putative metallopeptidase [Parvibaculum sp.]